MKTLRAAGFTDEQTDAIATVFDDNTVTRDYLDLKLGETRAELRGEITASRDEFRSEIGAVKSELAELRSELRVQRSEARVQVYTIAFAVVAAIVALTRLIP